MDSVSDTTGLITESEKAFQYVNSLPSGSHIHSNLEGNVKWMECVTSVCQ